MSSVFLSLIEILQATNQPMFDSLCSGTIHVVVVAKLNFPLLCLMVRKFKNVRPILSFSWSYSLALTNVFESWSWVLTTTRY